MNIRTFCSTVARLLPALLLGMAAPAIAQKGDASPKAYTPFAAPIVSTISGAPLTVRVGDEHSFQVLNADVPGVGQLYPSGSSGTADMGWIVHAGGLQYGPDFDEHSNGSASGNLGPVVPYDGRTISAVSGNGSAASPYEVTVSNTLGTSGLNSHEVVRYVNGENYFTKSFTLTNNGSAAQDVSIFLGGDIYLAGDDSGIPYIEAASGSIGGSDCGAPPSYYILYIPLTPADHYTGSSYSSLWSQIGNGALDDTLATQCIDNAAGLQWDRTIPAGSSVTVTAATSFGDIPVIAQFSVTGIAPASGMQGSTVNVTITGLGFAPGMTITLDNGITVGNLVVVDGNTATATLTIAGTAALGPRDVTGTSADGTLTDTLVNGFTVTAEGSGPGPGPSPGAVAIPSTGAIGRLLLLFTLMGTAFVALRRF